MGYGVERKVGTNLVQVVGVSLGVSIFKRSAPNNVLEPPRLSRLEFERGFGFVGSLPAG